MRTGFGSPAMCAMAVAAALLPLEASAAPPGELSVAVERLFGFSRLTIESSGDSYSISSISVFSNTAGHLGYSSPRLAFDWFASGGVSFGGAVGFQTVEDQEAWLVAARVGYFARVSPGFGLWPRGGLTHIGSDGFDESSATAVTLEVPLEFIGRRGLALSLTPYAEIGVGGRDESGADRTLTELGLQLGAGAFF